MAVAAALAAVKTKRDAESGKDDEDDELRAAMERAARPSGHDLTADMDSDAESTHAGGDGNKSTLPPVRVLSEETQAARIAAQRAARRSGQSDMTRRRNSVDALVDARMAELAEANNKAPPKPGSVRWYQQVARVLYETPAMQMGVAGLIAANFLFSAVEAQLAESSTPESIAVFSVTEWIFAVAFTVELVWNAAAYWLKEFWASGWNVFDVFIVAVTWAKLLLSNLPGVGVLRLFRAFRVFRLFKRIESLRTIIEAVFASLPAVGNAFIVLGILMGIWSIIGVEFFGEYAEQHFATFTKAMFTMWQIMTLDGWALIARRLIYGSSSTNEITAPIFFVSYTFIAAIVMTNVVIAILLDNYLRAIDRAKEEKEEAEALRREEEEKAALEQKRQRIAAGGDDETQIIDASAASELAPTVVPQVMAKLCSPRKLRRMGRDQLLELAAVLFSNHLSRDRLLHYAHAKVAGGKVPEDTVAGDLLRALAGLYVPEEVLTQRASEASVIGSSFKVVLPGGGAFGGLGGARSASGSVSLPPPRATHGDFEPAGQSARASGGVDAVIPLSGTSAAEGGDVNGGDDEGRRSRPPLGPDL